MSEGTELIRVAQLPVIEERLREVKDSWERTAKENMALVCTEDTIQTVKAARADMTKQFNELEALRKAVKGEYMKAYDAFEETYRECITGPYKAADAALKGKISDTENEIKRRCEERCRRYFEEVCAVYGIDFVKYEYMHLRIDMASARQKEPRKLFSGIAFFLEGIKAGIDKIDRSYPPNDERDEITAEFKQCLDVGEAITRVEQRHSRIEAERRAAEERAERQKREAEAVAKVEAAAPVLAPPVAVEAPRAEPVLTCTFTARGTRAQLIKVREFLKQEGIEYE